MAGRVTRLRPGARVASAGRACRTVHARLLGWTWFAKVLDADLASHGYQLWTATVGTLIEAAKHGAEVAILVVHQFALETSGERSGSDRRDWAKALSDNDYALASFVATLTTTGEATSYATEFVPEGIALRVRKALRQLAPPAETADC